MIRKWVSQDTLFLLWYMVYIIDKFLFETEEVVNENI